MKILKYFFILIGVAAGIACIYCLFLTIVGATGCLGETGDGAVEWTAMIVWDIILAVVSVGAFWISSKFDD